jgi:hypothetical protein
VGASKGGSKVKNNLLTLENFKIFAMGCIMETVTLKEKRQHKNYIMEPKRLEKVWNERLERAIENVALFEKLKNPAEPPREFTDEQYEEVLESYILFLEEHGKN